MLADQNRKLLRFGAILIGIAVLSFVAPMLLANHCLHNLSFIALGIGFVALVGCAFHPSVVQYVGAVDIGAYILADADERRTRFLGSITLTYFRILLFALCIYMTSMTRLFLVAFFRNEDVSLVSLLFPFYLILVRKKMFGGKYEEYLARYLWTSMIIIMAILFMSEVFPGIRLERDASCQLRHLIDEVGMRRGL